MRRSGWPAIGWVIASLALAVSPAIAQKAEVSVLYRQESDSGYVAFVPGFTRDGTVDCAADLSNELCSKSRAAAPGEPALGVTGTTLSLLLPDGRVAVVNCLTKYSSKGTALNRRCAMPLVEHVQAQFTGQSAKLKWPVGPDGKKTESESYRVVAFLPRKQAGS
ncbi:MAG TPA: hypothetical protein VKR52_00360 [Terracidiphilus sp.]|nr:hypothetical protein [Terracidiphilus sp.]